MGQSQSLKRPGSLSSCLWLHHGLQGRAYLSLPRQHRATSEAANPIPNPYGTIHEPRALLYLSHSSPSQHPTEPASSRQLSQLTGLHTGHCSKALCRHLFCGLVLQGKTGRLTLTEVLHLLSPLFLAPTWLIGLGPRQRSLSDTLLLMVPFCHHHGSPGMCMLSQIGKPRQREKFSLQEAERLELECLSCFAEPCGQTGQLCASMDPGIGCLSHIWWSLLKAWSLSLQLVICLSMHVCSP